MPLNPHFPGSGRPTYCLGGSIYRHGARYDKPYNCRHFKINNEPNNDANKFLYNYRYDCSSISRFNSVYNQLFRSRYSSLFR